VALRELVELFDFRRQDRKLPTARQVCADEIHRGTDSLGREWFVRWFDTTEARGLQSQRERQDLAHGQSWPPLRIRGGQAGRRWTLWRSTWPRPRASSSPPPYDGFDPPRRRHTYPAAKRTAASSSIRIHGRSSPNHPGRRRPRALHYSRVNPATRNDHIEEYECEPYCYAQNILRTSIRNSVWAGTLGVRHRSWMYQASTKYILAYANTSLRIDPASEGLEASPRGGASAARSTKSRSATRKASARGSFARGGR
jgi:hypothetical protein